MSRVSGFNGKLPALVLLAVVPVGLARGVVELRDFVGVIAALVQRLG
jgi:hypothetical protein